MIKKIKRAIQRFIIKTVADDIKANGTLWRLNDDSAEIVERYGIGARRVSFPEAIDKLKRASAEHQKAQREYVEFEASDARLK